MDNRIAPRTIGWIAWAALVTFSAIDALSSSAFMAKIGVGFEFNPLVASVWADSGAAGLLIFKVAMASFFGLILVVIATRESLAVIVSLSALTLWAVIANLSIGPISSTTAVLLFSPLAFIIITIAVGILFWTKIYPRIAERRSVPRIHHSV